MIILILLRIRLGKIMYLKHWRSYLKQDSILYPLLSKTLTNIYCDFFFINYITRMTCLYYFLFACLSLVSPISEKDNIDTILFIGNAFGKPGLDNKAIDPSVINFINNYSTDKYSYIVWEILLMNVIVLKKFQIFSIFTRVCYSKITFYLGRS